MVETRDVNLDFIKSLAIITMVIDHLKFIFVEHLPYFYTIGRFAFIAFAFITAVHCIRFFKASNPQGIDSAVKYLKYMVVFFFISEIPYQLLVFDSIGFHAEFNIFLTLFLGVLGCYILSQNKLHALLFFAVCYLFTPIIQYGALGVGLVMLFYLTLKEMDLKTLFFSLFLAPLTTLQFLWHESLALNISVAISGTLSALLCFYIYIKAKSLPKILPVGKWMWWFYPIHLIIIYFIVNFE